MTSSQEDSMDEPSADSAVKPTDAQTSAEKAKAKHDQALKDKEELDQAKKRKDIEREKA